MRITGNLIEEAFAETTGAKTPLKEAGEIAKPDSGVLKDYVLLIGDGNGAASRGLENDILYTFRAKAHNVDEAIDNCQDEIREIDRFDDYDEAAYAEEGDEDSDDFDPEEEPAMPYHEYFNDKDPSGGDIWLVAYIENGKLIADYDLGEFSADDFNDPADASLFGVESSAEDDEEGEDEDLGESLCEASDGVELDVVNYGNCDEFLRRYGLDKYFEFDGCDLVDLEDMSTTSIQFNPKGGTPVGELLAAIEKTFPQIYDKLENKIVAAAKEEAEDLEEAVEDKATLTEEPISGSDSLLSYNNEIKNILANVKQLIANGSEAAAVYDLIKANANEDLKYNIEHWARKGENLEALLNGYDKCVQAFAEAFTEEKERIEELKNLIQSMKDLAAKTESTKETLKEEVPAEADELADDKDWDDFYYSKWPASLDYDVEVYITPDEDTVGGVLNSYSLSLDGYMDDVVKYTAKYLEKPEEQITKKDLEGIAVDDFEKFLADDDELGDKAQEEAQKDVDDGHTDYLDIAWND